MSIVEFFGAIYLWLIMPIVQFFHDLFYGGWTWGKEPSWRD